MSTEQIDVPITKKIIVPLTPNPAETFQTHDHGKILKKMKCCGDVGIRAPAIFENWPMPPPPLTWDDMVESLHAIEEIDDLLPKHTIERPYDENILPQKFCHILIIRRDKTEYIFGYDIHHKVFGISEVELGKKIISFRNRMIRLHCDKHDTTTEIWLFEDRGTRDWHNNDKIYMFEEGSDSGDEGIWGYFVEQPPYG